MLDDSSMCYAIGKIEDQAFRKGTSCDETMKVLYLDDIQGVPHF